jgi:hypothetical protein
MHARSVALLFQTAAMQLQATMHEGVCSIALLHMDNWIPGQLGVLGCLGLSWAVLGCLGLSWAVLGCLGLSWAVLGCLGLLGSWALGAITS